LADVIKDAVSKDIAKKSEGALVIKISDNQPPFIIQKSDGSFLYSTTDLATIKYRVKKFKPDLILYVVANEQSLHFEQLFRAADLLGYAPNTKLVHVKFGLMLSPEGEKFSTREGRYIKLEQVIYEAIERAGRINKETAEIVGLAALKYNDLSQNRISDIVFDWEKMLSLKGNSAPYLQYTYTRLQSILKKKKFFFFNPAFLKDKRELEIIMLLDQFPDILKEITENYYPNYLADYLYKLAQRINSFYESLPVLKAEKETARARLALISCASAVIKNGLNLLGIAVPEKM
jgi:arginyl-tRNA synthetase